MRLHVCVYMERDSLIWKHFAFGVAIFFFVVFLLACSAVVVTSVSIFIHVPF